MQHPISLTESQMSAVLAASYPLDPDRRNAFLEACALELAQLPEVGDGAVHRVVMQMQRKFFLPPEVGPVCMRHPTIGV
jgi:hypothetical protein